MSRDYGPSGDSFNSGQSREVNKSFSQKLLLTLSKPWEERCNLYSLGNKDLLIFISIFFFFSFRYKTKKGKIKESKVKKGRKSKAQHSTTKWRRTFIMFSCLMDLVLTHPEQSCIATISGY